MVKNLRVIKQAVGLPWCLSGKESACRRPRFNPWVRKVPWRKAWQPTPEVLPGQSHGQRSLVGYSPWGHKESDTTEVTQHKRMHKELLSYQGFKSDSSSYLTQQKDSANLWHSPILKLWSVNRLC